MASRMDTFENMAVKIILAFTNHGFDGTTPEANEMVKSRVNVTALPGHRT